MSNRAPVLKSARCIIAGKQRGGKCIEFAFKVDIWYVYICHAEMPQKLTCLSENVKEGAFNEML